MRIGMILLGGTKFPPDIRVDKEVRPLISEGHEISLLTEYSGEDKFVDTEYISGLKISRIDISERSSLIKLLTLQYFTLIDKRYLSFIKDFIDSEKPDILHVHDFHMLPTIYKCLDRYKIDIEVIADLHENYPAALRAYISEYPVFKKFVSSILLNYRLWRWHERRYLLRCSRVITVVEEANKRLVEYGIPADRITIVSNTENEETFNVGDVSVAADLTKRYSDRFVVSYIGGIGAHRGLQTVLKAVRQCVLDNPDFSLLIVGAKKNDIKMIEGLIADLGISDLKDSIDIVGWVPFSKVNEYIAISDVCMVPHEDFEHTQTTVPHKLFQYMMGKKTVLVSDCAPLKRIVGENNIGYVFQAGNPASFAETVKEIANADEAEKRDKCARAYDLATGPYSWTKDAERLVSIYK